MRTPVVGFWFAVSFLLLLQQALAQVTTEQIQRAFTVGPTSVTVDAYPGRRGVKSKVTIVTKNTPKPTRFSIQVMDLAQSKSGAKSAVELGRGVRSAAPWIAISPEVVVPPNARHVVPFTVNVPPNAEGAYFAYVIIQLVPERSEAWMATVIQPAVAVEITVKTRSRAPLHVDVTDLSLGRSEVSGRWEMAVRAKNTGKWKVSVEGDILLYAAKGTFPVRVPLPYKQSGKAFEIYPGSEVVLNCPLAEVPPAGRYKVNARLLLNRKYQSMSHLDLEIPKSLVGKRVAANLLSKSEFDFDLSVEPNLIEVSISPGATRTVPIRIRNRDERPAYVKATVTDARMEPNGLLTFPAGLPQTAGWVTLSPDSMEVRPRRTSVFKTQIKVPRDTSGFGTIVRAIHINVSGPPTGGEWESNAEFGVLLVGTDPKAPPAKLVISKPMLIRTSPEKNPSAVLVTLTNSGGQVVRVAGKIVLERATGQKIATMQIGDPVEEIILPGNYREFRMPLPPVDAGKFRVRAELASTGRERLKAESEAMFTSTTAIPTGLR